MYNNIHILFTSMKIPNASRFLSFSISPMPRQFLSGWED